MNKSLLFAAALVLSGCTRYYDHYDATPVEFHYYSEGSSPGSLSYAMAELERERIALQRERELTLSRIRREQSDRDFQRRMRNAAFRREIEQKRRDEERRFQDNLNRINRQIQQDRENLRRREELQRQERQRLDRQRQEMQRQQERSRADAQRRESEFLRNQEQRDYQISVNNSLITHENEQMKRDSQQRQDSARSDHQRRMEEIEAQRQRRQQEQQEREARRQAERAREQQEREAQRQREREERDYQRAVQESLRTHQEEERRRNRSALASEPSVAPAASNEPTSEEIRQAGIAMMDWRRQNPGATQDRESMRGHLRSRLGVDDSKLNAIYDAMYL